MRALQWWMITRNYCLARRAAVLQSSIKRVLQMSSVVTDTSRARIRRSAISAAPSTLSIS